MISLNCLIFNQLEERCSIVWDESGECVVIDPGCCSPDECSQLDGFIASKSLKPVKILLTHGHFDHIYGVRYCMDKYGISTFMNPLDKPVLAFCGKMSRMFGVTPAEAGFLTEDIKAGDILRFGNTSIEVIGSPGHTPGGVCFLFREDKLLISGDTLFAGSIGRTDGPGGDYDALISGILGTLMLLDGDTDVVPGHGPCTTIADERQKNPFLRPIDEFTWIPEEGEDR